jgi:hypothetical protein
MLIGFRRIVAFSAVLAACRPSTEMSGIYINQSGAGVLFPCDDAKIKFVVQDSALEAQYRSTATALQPVFVRLRGVKTRTGSPKGGGQRLFHVRQILEVRGRASGECPGVAQSVAPLLSTP